MVGSARDARDLECAQRVSLPTTSPVSSRSSRGGLTRRRWYPRNLQTHARKFDMFLSQLLDNAGNDGELAAEPIG